MTHVLLCVDFIEEIVGPSGRLAQKGYRDFAERRGTLARLAARQEEVRTAGGRVVHVGLCFAPDYSDYPRGSPLLGAARSAGILRKGTPSVDFAALVGPQSDDLALSKNRISPFHGTGLEAMLLGLGTQTVEIAGVATDLAVQSAARDAHDRAISNLAKFAAIL